MLKNLLRFLPRPLRVVVLRFLITPRKIAPGLTCGIARTAEDLDGAARLVHDAYVGAGMIAPDPSGRREVMHLKQPHAMVIVAKDGGRVIGTIGVVADGPRGLPMDEVHPAEMAARRRGGRLMIECCSAAIDPAYRRQGLQSLMGVLMVHVARQVLGGDDLVITVKPSAADVYVTTLMFAPFTPVRTNPALDKRVPSLGMTVALDTIEVRLRRRDRFWPAGRLNQHWVFFGHRWACVERPSREEALAAQRALLGALPAAAASPSRSVRSLGIEGQVAGVDERDGLALERRGGRKSPQPASAGRDEVV